jgi:hypothetical protein
MGCWHCLYGRLKHLMAHGFPDLSLMLANALVISSCEDILILLFFSLENHPLVIRGISLKAPSLYHLQFEHTFL